MLFKEAIKVEGGLMIGDILRATSHSGIVYIIGGDSTISRKPGAATTTSSRSADGSRAHPPTLDSIPGYVYVYCCNQ